MGGGARLPGVGVADLGAREPARVLSGDPLRPRTLRETGETVDLHRHPWFALDKKCGKLRGEDDDRMDTLDLDLDLDLKVNAHANCDDLAVRILPPVAAPPVFLGTGLNYHRHAAECGLAPPRVPILAFCKPSTALQRPGGSIAVPACCDPDVPEVDWEVELAVVIGEHRDTGELCKNATAETALDYVLGYTVANDVSARLWQTDPERTGGQWNRGKSFDTFAPLGPAMVLQERGFDLVSGGTDNHLILMDLGSDGISGKEAEDLLGQVSITVNKNTVAGETRSPFVTSGVRIGTPAMTSRGMTTQDAAQIGAWIADTLESGGDAGKLAQIRGAVHDWCAKHPMPQLHIDWSKRA